jgi:hypothetical protein
MSVNIRARAVREPEHLLVSITGRLGGGDYPVPITPQNYKFIEEQARKRANISIEECFNQIMEEEMKREMLKEVNPFDEKVRRWWEEGKKGNNNIDK